MRKNPAGNRVRVLGRGAEAYIMGHHLIRLIVTVESVKVSRVRPIPHVQVHQNTSTLSYILDAVCIDILNAHTVQNGHQLHVHG